MVEDAIEFAVFAVLAIAALIVVVYVGLWALDRLSALLVRLEKRTGITTHTSQGFLFVAAFLSIGFYETFDRFGYEFFAHRIAYIVSTGLVLAALGTLVVWRDIKRHNRSYTHKSISDDSHEPNNSIQ